MRRFAALSALSERFGRSNFFGSYDIKGISAKRTRAFSSGRIAVGIRFISRLLAYTSSRAYGCAALTFGLLTLVLHLGEYYFRDAPAVATDSLVIGTVFALLSIFLFISDKPICIALQSFKITDYIFFEFFSIGRLRHSENERSVPIVVGIFFGFALAIVGFLLPTLYAVLFVFGILFVSLSMISPELPFISSILIYPYITLIPKSEWLLCALTVITVISFLRKAAVGKRAYSVEIYDILFLLLAITALVTGVILGSGESVEPSILVAVYLFVYIPAANIAVNRRLCDSVVSAVVVSSVPPALYSLITYIMSIAADSKAASSAWFASREAYAAYLSVAVLFALYLFFEKKKKLKRLAAITACILGLLALITTECLVLTIAIPIAALMFSVIRSKRLPKIFLVALLLLPFAIFLVPEWIFDRVSALIGISFPFSELRTSAASAWGVFADNILAGAGAEGLGEYFNSYFGIAAGFGVFAVLIFLLILFMRITHLDVYAKYFPSQLVGFHVEMSALAPLVMLIIGSFADIFRDINTVYFLVVVFGIGSAALRISRRETEQRLSYYDDSISHDYAAIDVNMK